ncbi:MAG: DUF362 domain-containing protein [Promethearchaeota archaeon]
MPKKINQSLAGSTMASQVFYFNARVKTYLESLSAIKGPIALEETGFPTNLAGKKVCVKTHFGALANVRYLRPSYARFLCDKVKELGGEPTLAESCGVGLPSGDDGQYAGRETEERYLECAKRHGFTPETMGAPIVMLDGPLGLDYVEVPVEGLRFQTALVAGRLREFDLLVVATHFKGHGLSGFGGTIKNLGIGCVAKGGKAEAHHSKRMDVETERCVDGCTKCVDVCPTGALEKKPGNVVVRDDDKCRRCRWCHSVCPQKVFVTDSVDRYRFIDQMVDNALGVLEFVGRENAFFLNFVLDVCPECDCSGQSDLPVVPDVGIVAGTDPVAVDQASVDLVHAQPVYPGSRLDEAGVARGQKYLAYLATEDGEPTNAWEYQLEAAERVGLGSREYDLVEMD